MFGVRWVSKHSLELLVPPGTTDILRRACSLPGYAAWIAHTLLRREDLDRCASFRQTRSSPADPGTAGCRSRVESRQSPAESLAMAAYRVCAAEITPERFLWLSSNRIMAFSSSGSDSLRSAAIDSCAVISS